jgi:hypothetical protein
VACGSSIFQWKVRVLSRFSFVSTSRPLEMTVSGFSTVAVTSVVAKSFGWS